MAELGVLLIGASFLLLALAVIPTLIELRRTITEIKAMLSMLNAEFVPLLREVRAVTEHVNSLADQAEQGVERVSGLFQQVGRLGDTVHRVQTHPLVANALVLSAGVRAAMSVFRQRFQRRSPANGRRVSQWDQ